METACIKAALETALYTCIQPITPCFPIKPGQCVDSSSILHLQLSLKPGNSLSCISTWRTGLCGKGNEDSSLQVKSVDAVPRMGLCNCNTFFEKQTEKRLQGKPEGWTVPVWELKSAHQWRAVCTQCTFVGPLRTIKRQPQQPHIEKNKESKSWTKAHLH